MGISVSPVHAPKSRPFSSAASAGVSPAQPVVHCKKKTAPARRRAPANTKAPP